MPISTIGTDGLSTSPTLTTPKATTTIGVGNATPSASGAGISFPATQSASSDANTLDDYEEGTFTPVVTGGTTAGVGTYAYQLGVYTKIGNTVFIKLYLNWSAHTGTGSLNITSLPFTSKNDGVDTALSVGYIANLTLTASNVITAIVLPNASQIALYQYPVGGLTTSVVAMDNAAGIEISGSYLATA
jgi:hypothetical protein